MLVVEPAVHRCYKLPLSGPVKFTRSETISNHTLPTSGITRRIKEASGHQTMPGYTELTITHAPLRSRSHHGVKMGPLPPILVAACCHLLHLVRVRLAAGVVGPRDARILGSIHARSNRDLDGPPTKRRTRLLDCRCLDCDALVHADENKGEGYRLWMEGGRGMEDVSGWFDGG